MSQSLYNFESGVHSWVQTSSNFDDIYAETNLSDNLEWHVTFTRSNNNNEEFKFHFMVLFPRDYPLTQPKISMVYGQRLLVETSNAFGNWIVLMKAKLYTVTNVLLQLRSIVRNININSLNSDFFNSRECAYCRFGICQKSTEPEQQQIPQPIPQQQEQNNTKEESVISSPSKSDSTISLTVSHFECEESITSNTNINDNNNSRRTSISSSIGNTTIPKIKKNKKKKYQKKKKFIKKEQEPEQEQELEEQQIQQQQQERDDSTEHPGVLTVDENGCLKWVVKPKYKTRFCIKPKFSKNYVNN